MHLLELRQPPTVRSSRFCLMQSACRGESSCTTSLRQTRLVICLFRRTSLLATSAATFSLVVGPSPISKPRRPIQCAPSLDDFFREQKLESLYHVAIDTEGWDALVVEGMRHTLAQRRVAVLEFEVNGGGMWSFERKRGGQSPGRTVEHTLSMLHSAGYACFWLLKNALLPASGACWLPEFGGRPKWSNIVCAHEPQVIRVLDDMAREAYVSRQSVRQQGAVPTSVAAA